MVPGPAFQRPGSVTLSVTNGDSTTVSVDAPGGYAVKVDYVAPGSLLTACHTSSVVKFVAIDIDQSVTNTCGNGQTNAILNLTNSYWGAASGGSVTWTSSPAGLSPPSGSGDTFTFNPSNSVATTYVVTAYSDLLTNCYDTCTVRILKVDLDVDTNMDDDPDNDDAQEMDMRGIIVGVNNDSDVAGAAIDNQNGTIDGATDKGELTELWLRKVPVLPSGYKVKLKVDDKSRLRIFDDTDTARIGPVAADGGPDQDEYEVPSAGITAGDLKYLVEGFNYGHVICTLAIEDGAGNEVCKDTVRMVINVDRKPGDTYSAIRNRIQVFKTKANLEGLEAKLEGAKPLISWGKPRYYKTTSYWVSIQKNDISSWLQTGVRVRKTTAGVESEQHYVEFVPNWTGYSLPPTDPNYDPDGYKVIATPSGGWTSGKFKVEITDRATGKAEAFFGGSSWEDFTHNNFKTVNFENYQIGTEPKQSIARNPGKNSARGKVSEAKYKDNTGWHNTAFAAGDVKMTVYDGKGNASTTASTAAGASLFEFNAKWLSGQSYELWDNREW